MAIYDSIKTHREVRDDISETQKVIDAVTRWVKKLERKVVKEQIGVNTMASTFGSMTGPPAESEYPVEPVCVAMIMPSASS